MPPDRIPALAAYARGGPVVIHDGRQPPFALTPEMAPRVTARAPQPCLGSESSDRRETCDFEASVPLERLTFSPDGRVALAPDGPPSGCFLPSKVEATSIAYAEVVAGELSIPVSPQDLPRVLAYAHTRQVTLPNAGNEIAIEPLQRPVLHLRVTSGCAMVPECSGGRVVAALESVLWDSGTLLLCRGRDVVLAPGGKGELVLELERAPRYKPRFGFGVDIAGPALFVSVSGQWYPADWIVLEAGIVPFANNGNGAWAGSRLRFPLGDYVVLSMGASAADYVTLDGYNENNAAGGRNLYLMGPRLAIELVLPSRRDVLRAEAQLAFGNLLPHPWHPWGGLAYMHWY